MGPDGVVALFPTAAGDVNVLIRGPARVEGSSRPLYFACSCICYCLATPSRNRLMRVRRSQGCGATRPHLNSKNSRIASTEYSASTWINTFTLYL